MMNMDLGKMTNQQIKDMLKQFGSMSDDQFKKAFEKLGANIDINLLREFVKRMENAGDDDIDKLKEQFKSGKININSFKKSFEEECQINLKKAKELMNNNKLKESIEICHELLEKINKKPEEKDKLKEIKAKVYDQLTLSRYTLQDYDTTITECTEAINDIPMFSVINRMGICYFKKGRHIKARDAFKKAKELFPNDRDTIADNYLKMALDEIENY